MSRMKNKKGFVVMKPDDTDRVIELANIVSKQERELKEKNDRIRRYEESNEARKKREAEEKAKGQRRIINKASAH